MRKRKNFFGVTHFNVTVLFASLASMLILYGCNSLSIKENGKGGILLRVDKVERALVDGVFLKSGVFNTDTNSFWLSVYSTTGKKVYDGLYGDKPKEFIVDAGSYDISLYSHKFNAPKFSTPVLGDKQTIIVNEGEQANVSFICRQVNAGIKLTFTKEFIDKFPGNGVNIAQGDNKLLYEYNQTKYAYFLPGSINFTYSKNGKDTLLLQKNVSAAQMLTMQLNYNVLSGSSSKFDVAIDTVRVWSNYKINVGLKIPDGVYTIDQAKQHIGEKGVAVFGYIYGADASTSSIKLVPPFKSNASLVIAPSMEEGDRANCFVVELPSGKVRENLNLVNNSFLLGTPVVVVGDIVESYYGHPGIKGTKSYTLL